MTAADLEPVIRNDRFTRKITFPIFIGIAILSLSASVYMFITNWWPYNIGFLLSGIALGALGYYLKSYYSDLLKKKEKVVLTGIIYKKRKFKDSDLVSISDKLEVFIESKDAKRLKLGDIVEIECLSLERYIKNTVTIKGDIYNLLKSESGSSDQMKL